MGINRFSTACPWTVLPAMIGLVFCQPGARALMSDDAFELGFRNSQDNTELSWLAQPGATGYQLLCSMQRSFSGGCVTFETSEIHQSDPTEPVPGDALYYMVRVLKPDPGSWGTDSEGFERTASCAAPTAGLVDFYGCKEWGVTGRARTDPSQDCVEYRYLGEGQLLLNHLNTAFNCCPEFEAGMDVDGNTIAVWEHEISGDCDCLCLFDLNYEIVGLAPGIYKVTVIQEYLDATDEPLDFTMDLLSSPSGIHCVERRHYPW